mmetsp:Transcript_55787/g.110831  ORF Transcript_55787/g.110831 Transcript_55787/m.110831 type:complete len:256 (-) Transcript_55787:76-843(-)
MVAPMVMPSSTALTHQSRCGIASMNKITEAVVAAVATARHVGISELESVPRPKKDSALLICCFVFATFSFARATLPLPDCSCQTVVRPTPPVSNGTAKSAAAVPPKVKFAATPAAVAASAGTSAGPSPAGMPRLAMPVTVRCVSISAPCATFAKAAGANVSSESILAPPKLVTATARFSWMDCETMPSSAAKRWTFRRLSPFNASNIMVPPTGSVLRLPRTDWLNSFVLVTLLNNSLISRAVDVRTFCSSALTGP